MWFLGEPARTLSAEKAVLQHLELGENNEGPVTADTIKYC